MNCDLNSWTTLHSSMSQASYGVSVVEKTNCFNPSMMLFFYRTQTCACRCQPIFVGNQSIFSQIRWWVSKRLFKFCGICLLKNWNEPQFYFDSFILTPRCLWLKVKWYLIEHFEWHFISHFEKCHLTNQNVFKIFNSYKQTLLRICILFGSHQCRPSAGTLVTKLWLKL